MLLLIALADSNIFSLCTRVCTVQWHGVAETLQRFNTMPASRENILRTFIPEDSILCSVIKQKNSHNRISVFR